MSFDEIVLSRLPRHSTRKRLSRVSFTLTQFPRRLMSRIAGRGIAFLSSNVALNDIGPISWSLPTSPYSNPASKLSAGLPRPPRLCTMSRNEPRLYGASRKSGTRSAKATSHNARINAMKEVLPVLFSPTRRVKGASLAVCSSRKHRKFLSVILSMSGL